MMIDTSDLMIPDEIKNGLGTRILGGEIISYAQVGSTNDVALSLANKGVKEGTLIVAESQTRGRGRRGRKWFSPAGTSILASLILRPSIKKAHIIAPISATAVVQAIHNITGLSALIKWPNDVVINSKKVSGILTEMKAEKGRINAIVIGMGINVNTLPNQFPAEIVDTATSLSIELGHNISRVALLQEILRQLERRYIELKDRNPDDFITEWKCLSATIGRQVRLDSPDKTVTGYALDIDEAGALLVRLDTGQMQRIMNDDVIQVTPF